MGIGHGCIAEVNCGGDAISALVGDVGCLVGYGIGAVVTGHSVGGVSSATSQRGVDRIGEYDGEWCRFRDCSILCGVEGRSHSVREHRVVVRHVHEVPSWGWY